MTAKIKESMILVINPGSTSTKVAMYHDSGQGQAVSRLAEQTIQHDPSRWDPAENVASQCEDRLTDIRDWLASHGSVPGLDLIMARGGPLQPLPGGIYSVNREMLEDLRSSRYANHASNLGALMADELAREHEIHAYISDPVTVDEFTDVARISGVPEIERRARSHALNIKASTRRAARELDLNPQVANFVVAHLGGGISIAAVSGLRILDVNDALLGMGPFGPERAGALPLAGMIDLAYSGAYSKQELLTKLSKQSGLTGYLGTADFPKIEQRIQEGDTTAKLVRDAMVYQIAKEIGAMSTVLKGDLNAIILTGGLSHSKSLVRDLSSRIATLAQILVYPGEGELRALAEAGLRVLRGTEQIREYRRKEG